MRAMQLNSIETGLFHEDGGTGKLFHDSVDLSHSEGMWRTEGERVHPRPLLLGQLHGDSRGRQRWLPWLAVRASHRLTATVDELHNGERPTSIRRHRICTRIVDVKALGGACVLDKFGKVLSLARIIAFFGHHHIKHDADVLAIDTHVARDNHAPATVGPSPVQTKHVCIRLATSEGRQHFLQRCFGQSVRHDGAAWQRHTRREHRIHRGEKKGIYVVSPHYVGHRSCRV